MLLLVTKSGCSTVRYGRARKMKTMVGKRFFIKQMFAHRCLNYTEFFAYNYDVLVRLAWALCRVSIRTENNVRLKN